jgi:hypothetical protein
MEVSVSPRIRIRTYNTGETCTLLNPPRLCKDVLEHLDTTKGWGRGELTETLEGEVISILVNDPVHAGSYTFREVRGEAHLESLSVWTICVHLHCMIKLSQEDWHKGGPH